MYREVPAGYTSCLDCTALVMASSAEFLPDGSGQVCSECNVKRCAATAGTSMVVQGAMGRLARRVAPNHKAMVLVVTAGVGLFVLTAVLLIVLVFGNVH